VGEVVGEVGEMVAVVVRRNFEFKFEFVGGLLCTLLSPQE
jgi:hypothetical protein